LQVAGLISGREFHRSRPSCTDQFQEFIMKKLLITLIGALTLSTTLPALAGPDWQIIEQARKAKQTAQAERRGDAYEALPPTGAGPQKCPPDALVLPLDHGPRALTTPSLNQQRKDRYEAQLAACKGIAK
jgi:hypothetical protein